VQRQCLSPCRLAHVPQEEAEDDDEEDDSEVFAPAAAAAKNDARPFVNNAEGLAATLREFAWPAHIAWVDTLVVPVRCGAFCAALRTYRS